MSNSTQPKAAPAAAAPKAAPSTPSVSTSTPAPPPAPQPVAASAALNPPATPSPMPAVGAGQTAPPTTAAASDSASTFNDPSALLVGNQGDGVIGQMEAMGFERAQIDRAMRAAFFNPDRAIEYLLTGIPENIQAEQRQGGGAARGAAAATSPAPVTAGAAAATSPPAAEAGADEPVNLFEAAAQAGQGRGGARGGARARGGAAATMPMDMGGAPGAPGAGDTVNMDFLRNSPHFQHLRQLVQQQPAMLEPILQQVAEGNPQLAQMIGQNQDQFLQLLSEVCG